MLIRFNIHHDKLPEFIMVFKQFEPYITTQSHSWKKKSYKIYINFKDAKMASMALLRYDGTLISSNQETVEFIGKIIC
jgi:hypothetical protein